MGIPVHIPGSLREYCGTLSELHVKGPTVADALRQLRNEHRSLYQSICDETGAVRDHINVFVNSDLIPAREPHGLDATISVGDVLTIWTAVSGG